VPAARLRFALVLAAAVALAGCAAPGTGPRARADLIVLADTVVTMDAARRVLEPGAVAVVDRRIAAVGPRDDVLAAWRAPRTLDAPRSVLIPGLVNAHTHAPMTLFRGLVDGLSLEAWLTTQIFPAEAAGLTPESVRAGMRLALAEMIRSGTTTFADMYYFEDLLAEETRAAGMRGVLGWTIIGFPVADASGPDVSLAATEAFLERFSGDPLVVPAVAPHSTYTLEPEALVRCAELADRFDAPLMMHLSETRAEVDEVLARHGRTPIAHADALGLLGARTVAAHVVHPTDDDVARLVRAGAGVVHCPQSNMKLGSGIAPVGALLAAGVPVGLGTDGAPSNDDLDLFEEIDTAAKLQKVARLDPTAFDARRAVELATLGGARVLGLDDRIGSIEVGKEADLVLLGGTRAGLVPRGDPWGFLAYVAKGSDVRSVVVAGRVLLEDGELTTIDEAAAAEAVIAWRARIDGALAEGG